MPKKQVRNAFYFFMKEEEPKLRREGRVFPNGMADMVPVCHPRWKALPEKDKERFEKMAKEYKAKMRGKEGDKYKMDNQGDLLAYRTNKYQDLEKRRMQERKKMRKNWPPGKELAEEKFYFVSFQILCRTEDGHYLPCEIAIIEYSLEKGITKHLHRFIEPGRIPTGYRFTCIEHSQDTHQIPVENFELADSNYLGLWNQIENFINPNGEKQEYPPLYCLGAQENYLLVEYCLDWIHCNARTGIPNRIRDVFEIEGLMYELCVHMGGKTTKAKCIAKLTSSEWEYEPDTKCKYHEELEVRDCSLGIVKRFAFAISDELCELYEFELTKNHIPMRKNLPSHTVLPPSTMPMYRTQPPPPRHKSTTYAKPPKKETIEDEEYSDLRIPKNPSQYAAGEPSSTNAWGSAMGGVIQNGIPPTGRGRQMQLDPGFVAANGSMGGVYNDPSPMPMGRGLSQVFQAGMNMSDRHAGRAGPPPANFAPEPPIAWKQQPVNIGFQEPMGIGRGMFLKNQSNVSMPPLPPQPVPSQAKGYSERNGVDLADDYAPLRLPGQTVPPRRFDDVEEQASSAPKIQIGRGSGGGYGGILEKLLKDGIRSGVSIGRGYMPADWVDDGSLGPMWR